MSKKPLKIDDDLLDIISEFVPESLDNLEMTETQLISFEKNPDPEIINTVFRTFHSLKGVAGFLNFNNILNVTHELETLLHIFRKNNLKFNQDHISLLLTMCDEMKKMIYHISKEYNDTGFEERVTQLIETISDHSKQLKYDLESGMSNDSDEIHPLEESLKAQNSVDLDNSIEEIESTDLIDSFLLKDIRVNTKKLDKLFDLVGELITAQIMAYNHPDLKQVNHDGFDRQWNEVSKITRELQEVTTTMRMIPLAGLFRKIRLQIRDLSTKSSKNVLFSSHGEETEMDRNVISLITDPLTHIIRNSVDHGIETEDVRTGSGKKPAGQISLSAQYAGNEIWLTIHDDGAGLDREKILDKARAGGLLKTDGIELTDDQVWQFIFMPGFSTAEKVTDVSGRGVGMDVVKKNITRVGGKISVSSINGQGTTITLKIPLTMAIIDSVNVRIDETFYSIPLVDVIEFFKPLQEQVVTLTDNNCVIQLRDELIPVVSVQRQTISLTQSHLITDSIAVIIEHSGRKICLLVDEVIGSQQIVVKPLSDFLGDVENVSGCSLIGNGDVSMILDTGSITSMVLQ